MHLAPLAFAMKKTLPKDESLVMIIKRLYLIHKKKCF